MFQEAFTLVSVNQIANLRGSNLVIEEHIDDWVNHGAELGQDGGHHADHGTDRAQPAQGGHQRYDAVGHPAQHVAGHHGQHHPQDVLLSALSRQQVDSARLKTRRDSQDNSTEWCFYFENITPWSLTAPNAHLLTPIRYRPRTPTWCWSNHYRSSQ